MNKRIFVEKRNGFDIESREICRELNQNFHLNLKEIRLFNLYDCIGLKDLEEWYILSRHVFSEIQTDQTFDKLDLKDEGYIAFEYLPGQFCARSKAALDCSKLLLKNDQLKIKSAKLILFPHILEKDLFHKIEKFLINPIECQKKNLSVINFSEDVTVNPVKVFDDFIEYNREKVKSFYLEQHLAMSFEDLSFIQKHYQENVKRPINEAELKVLDTYWSDHCRHTTFETSLQDIRFQEDPFSLKMKEVFEDLLETKKALNRKHKKLSLMEMTTLNQRLEKSLGHLSDLEESAENNACSIHAKVKMRDSEEDFLIMFKNETHNHPTEIEPVGGASTCLGGAIRDPLSGRSYVYQGMRITGCADLFESYQNTLEGKLPQREISKKACQGFSGYGNQIGIATTFVKEIYDDGYKAKRMEVGFVVGSTPLKNVRREAPRAGDVILLIGGATGRDGIGGATGSSKSHNEASILTCSSEVQKGNAPEERKLQRLFSQEKVSSLIKKSNDFGAGGVCVAIGELSDSIDIFLDRIPLKYQGLNPVEILISESQERMAVVIEEKDCEAFKTYAREENLTAVEVAKVTDTGYLRAYYYNDKIIDITRDFIDTHGVVQIQDVEIDRVNFELNPLVNKRKGNTLRERILHNLEDLNHLSQQGQKEYFDSTIGRTTVLMPFGGKYQLSECLVSAQNVYAFHKTTLSSTVAAYGYNPVISKWSPFHGSIYAILESLVKLVSVGIDYKTVRFSFQEYFERLGKDPMKWGKPFSALLGAYQFLKDLGLANIGGKDSMSGSFKEITVPPTLISFGLGLMDSDRVLSNELKEEISNIYLLPLHLKSDLLFNTDEVKQNFEKIYKLIFDKKIIACEPVLKGGISKTLINMSLGNKVGFRIETPLDLFYEYYGSFIVQSCEDLADQGFILLGKTIAEEELIFNQSILSFDEVIDSLEQKYQSIYPKYATSENPKRMVKESLFHSDQFFHYPKEKNKVRVFIPVFPGTNCEEDTRLKFLEQDSRVEVQTFIFQDFDEESIQQSIEGMNRGIDLCDILVFSGGFSSSDEPDGSGKFIANVILNQKIKGAIEALIVRKRLILGICNGFQALIKSGLLPFGKIGEVNESSPTLFRNDINRHVSKIVQTKLMSNQSPWLFGSKVGTICQVPISHGEGKFIIEEKTFKKLQENGQIAFCYTDLEGRVTNNPAFNLNGSDYGIEGIISPDGLILGKMGHSERNLEGLYKNVQNYEYDAIFTNAIRYFLGKLHDE